MEKIEIIQAGPEHLDRLMEWRMEVLDHVFPDSGASADDALMAANRDYYRRQIASGGHVACFALADGVTVGCGGICLQEELPSPDNPDGRCAYLMNVYCREAYRRRGVGRTIVRWLVGVAAEKGIRKIYLETTDSGRRLYRSVGFREMKDMMHFEQ